MTEQLAGIVSLNGMKRRYRKTVKSELKHSCAFVAVTDGAEEGEDPRPLVSMYPATSASALWSDRLNRIRAGMVVVDRDRRADRRAEPTWVNVYTDTAVIAIVRDGGNGWRPTTSTAWAGASWSRSATRRPPTGRSEPRVSPAPS